MSIFTKLRKKVEKSAGSLFKKNPLLFSALPAPLKKKVFDNEINYAQALQETVDELQKQSDEKRKTVEGLRLQLADQRAQPNFNDPFANTNAREYRKYVR